MYFGDYPRVPGPLGQMPDLHGPLGLTPIVVERTGSGERSWDIFSRLMKERIIFIGEGIRSYNANIIVAQLLFLQYEGKGKDISVYINSPGGSVTAGLAIYDTMKFIDCDIATYCIGQAASMGAVLLSGGTKGKRFALPSARIMIHQVSGGTYGTAADMRISVDECDRLAKRLYDILAENCGRSYEQVKKDCDRDYFMSAEEGVEYGIIDQVVDKVPRRED